MTPLRALVYDPYLATLGGGERYALSLAAVLSERAEVSVAAPDVPGCSTLEAMGLPTNFEFLQMNDRVFTERSQAFDLAVVVANRVPPTSRARESLLVVQFPFPGSWLRTPGRALRRRRILSCYRPIVYSEFVRRWCRKRWGIDPSVVSPYVSLVDHCPEPKVPLVLSVGRFFTGEHSKRQDTLIEAFRNLWSSSKPEWELVLAGGITADERSHNYLERLKRQAEGLPVRFEVNVRIEELEQLYRRASVFWHAAGFGRKARHPERAEHFGITTVEAMSHWVVPLVFDDGGQAEVVEKSCGVRWNTVEQLVEETRVILTDPVRRNRLAEASRAQSTRFSFERFASDIARVVGPPFFGGGDPTS
jgi:glycosyltransferase involved in cell wall biosynthesis